MPHWFRARAADYAVLLFAAAILTLPNLGGPSLWDVDEGVNAEAAREMREADTWVIPTFNYELRTAKPVMLYWLQRASYAAFGVSEWSARLPSVLGSWLTVLLTYELARRMFGRATGLLSGLVLASALEFCVLAHAATPDATLLLFTVLTYLCFWVGHENGGRGWWLPCAAACGLAALTKGPVGVALPGLVLLLYFAWNREPGRLLDRRLGSALLVFLLVAGPWYGLVAAETRGEWVKAFFVNENVNRALTPMEDHRGPVFYHAAALLALFAPWSAFIGATLWYGWKAAQQSDTSAPTVLQEVGRREHPSPLVGERRGWGEGVDGVTGAVAGGSTPEPSIPAPSSARVVPPSPTPLPQGGRGDSAPRPHAPGLADSIVRSVRPHRFLLCWFAAYLAVFSLVSTKLPNYVLPLYPALAILTARFLVRWRESELPVPRWLMPAGVAAVALVGVGAGGGLLVAGGAIDVPRMRTFAGLDRWAVLGLIPLAAAAALAWRLRAADRRGFVAVAAVASVAFVASLAAFGPGAIDPYKSPRGLVADSRLSDPTRDLRAGSYEWFQPSVVFYARREVAKLPGADAAAAFLAVPTPGYLFIPEPTWRDAVAAKVTVPCRVAARRFDFYQNCDILVVTNDPGPPAVAGR